MGKVYYRSIWPFLNQLKDKQSLLKNRLGPTGGSQEIFWGSPNKYKTMKEIQQIYDLKCVCYFTNERKKWEPVNSAKMHLFCLIYEAGSGCWICSQTVSAVLVHFASFICQVGVVVNISKRASLDFSTDVSNTSNSSVLEWSAHHCFCSIFVNIFQCMF